MSVIGRVSKASWTMNNAIRIGDTIVPDHFVAGKHAKTAPCGHYRRRLDD